MSAHWFAIAREAYRRMGVHCRPSFRCMERYPGFVRDSARYAREIFAELRAEVATERLAGAMQTR